MKSINIGIMRNYEAVELTTLFTWKSFQIKLMKCKLSLGIGYWDHSSTTNIYIYFFNRVIIFRKLKGE